MTKDKCNCNEIIDISEGAECPEDIPKDQN